jgi:2-aminoadipate transaminase
MEEMLGSVLGKYGSKALQYDASEGWGPLREALVPHLKARGVTTTSDGVLIMSGSQSLLDGIGKILISPGDYVAVEAPTYLGALQAFNPYEPRYAEIETDEDGLLPESLDRVLTEHRVKFVYLVPTFQNPTGRTLTLARRHKVAEILKRHEALLLEDDPYSDLRYSGEPVPPIKSLAPENVVYSTTLSKTFAPGLRIGVCVAPEFIQRWLVTGRQGVDLHTNTLAQALAAEYLTGGSLDRQLPKIIALYAPRQQAMLESLERHLPEDFTWSRPQGGMFVWIEGPKGFDAVELQRRVIERGVAFVPGRYFYVNEEEGAATLRMNFTAADPDTIEHAVSIIADAIAELL